MDFFEDEDDYFGEYNDYFGFKGDEIPREGKDENCNELYRPGDIFSSIKPHSEYMNLEQERKYGPQSYSFPPFSVRHETTGYKKPAVGPAAYPLEGSHNASTGHSSPRQMPPEMPCSVIAQHIDSNLFQDEAPVSLTSDMFQLPDFLETDTQSAEWEKKNTPQWKQEKNHEKSQLLFLQPGKSSGKMNSRDFMEVYKIRRPSRSNDQHIKVVTSRGPRDRRMRLSIQTAIKFFDVQDRLGFDQPSKAVEWLIQKSRSAIDQLPAVPPSSLEKSSHVNSNPDSLLPFLHRDTDSKRADFVTGCEENIGIVDSLSPSLLTEPSIMKRQSRSQVIKTDHPRKKSVKTAVGKCTGTRRDSTSLKEIRFKARERARERTKEKRYTGGMGAFVSQHMNHIAALEIEALSLRENTASASSENTLKDNLEASLSHLYCVDPPFKSGLKESSLSRVFRHHGRSLLAQDSVEKMGENSHLSGHSNLSSNYSQNPIQSSVPTVAQCYKHQPEERSMQSTGSCIGLCSTTLPQAVSPMDGNLQTTISDYSLLQISGIRSYD